MKQLEKFFSHTCIYTVLISMTWYGILSTAKATGISLLSYFLIFSFSLILSSMEYVFTLKRVNKFLQYVIHYIVLCVAFNVIFIALRKSDSDYEFKPSMIFAAIFLFSVIYAVISIIVLLVKKSKAGVSKKSDQASKPSSYKSRFK